RATQRERLEGGQRDRVVVRIDGRGDAGLRGQLVDRGGHAAGEGSTRAAVGFTGDVANGVGLAVDFDGHAADVGNRGTGRIGDRGACQRIRRVLAQRRGAGVGDRVDGDQLAGVRADLEGLGGEGTVEQLDVVERGLRGDAVDFR